MWLVAPGREPSVAFAETGAVRALGLDDQGGLVAAVTADHIVIFDLPSRRRLTQAPVVAERLTLSHTGRQVATYAPGGTRVQLWEFGAGRDLVRTAASLPDAGQELPGGPEGVSGVLATNAPALRLPTPLPAKRGRLSADAQTLHVELADGAVQVWNLARLRERLGSYGLGC